MTKLKPYTIIPSDLYVKRDADRQLKQILEDMGRPGYVLVSRQMGKTNLLLNAKREAETPDDIFVYIDLSNTFSSEKDCFQNIVDTILEINEEKLREASTLIHQARIKNLDLPPHKQHTSELKQILNCIKGKLVIILDEIDALTKTNYSDKIFSQIRSIYFTRVNFPEFSRLTYILSGVVEPSEIIKDSKISPFNIGQKIFLNDFNYEEFRSFVKKAELSASEDVLKHIFNWTNGNPRITWDVCAEVEKLKKDSIVKEDIDGVIKKLYLTEFDKPPVDNIREILKKDAELRDAIIEIEYKNGAKISDRIKSKLYLSGIINYENGDVNIKNEIIRQSINLNWIRTVNEEEKGLITIALEHYQKREYKKCLSTFKAFLKNNSFPASEASICYYYMGFSAFKESKIKEALKYLQKTDFDTEDETKYFYICQNLKGLVHLYLGNFEDSLQNFKSVLSRSKKDEIYARALVNFGSVSLKSENPIHIEEAQNIFENIIEEKNIDSQKLEASLLNELKAISYYNLGQIEWEFGNKNSKRTRELFQKAAEIAPIHLQPKILLTSLNAIEEEKDQEIALTELVEILKNSSIKPTEFDPDQPMSFDIDQFKELLVHLISLDKKEMYREVIRDLKTFESKGIGENLFSIASECLRKYDKTGVSTARKILEDIYENRANPLYDLQKQTIYKTLKVLAYFSNPQEDPGKLNKYIGAFKEDRFEEIDFIDIENFANYIYYLAARNNFKEALEIISMIKALKQEVSDQYLFNYLLIYNLELNIYLRLSNETKSREVAGQILMLTKDKNNYKNLSSSVLNQSGIAVIKSNAESVLKPKLPTFPVTKENRKLNRNDQVKVRYVDGRVITTKYKKVTEDLRLGLCSLVD